MAVTQLTISRQLTVVTGSRWPSQVGPRRVPPQVPITSFAFGPVVVRLSPRPAYVIVLAAPIVIREKACGCEQTASAEPTYDREL